MPDSPTRPVIRTPDQRLRVFVSSTLQELADERVAARTAIVRLRLAPVMFELGARPHPPRDLYRAYLEQSHIFIGIYWQKYGWVAPGMDVSGLEDEYRQSGNRPKLIYIKSPAPDREPRLKDLLDQIKADESVSYKSFATADELHDLIENDLAMVLSERFEMTRQAGVAPRAGVPERHNHNLPTPRTPLVGRVREVGLARDLLLRESPPVRLVTLTGPGGSGKTRLALQVAHDLLDRFAGGGFFVALAPVADPRLVIPAIAQVLNVREAGGRPLIDSLKDYLREKRMLLVLDNFEQVVSAAPVVVELLDAGPFLKALVTSRTSLRVRAERELPVLPLALPDRKRLPETEHLSQYAAVKLFILRASDVKSDFALTNETAQVVAEICHRLDGLPLAIELAAARIKLLSPRALLARLESGLDMLAGGARDLPARQQTMRGTIAWSYDLLNDTEKALYRRLSVFVGGWTLEAAESVCGIGAIDVLDTLASLADKNLVRHEELPGGESRYGMLQMIREYALERLQEGGECAVVRRRHAEFCLSLAEAAEPYLMSADRNPWLDRLDLEHGNLRAALTWCMSTDGDPELGATLAGALTWFWFLRGHISEGRDNLEHALAGVPAPAGKFSRARCLTGAGGLAWTQGDYAVARRYLDEGVRLSRELHDEHRMAHALSLRGLVALSQADLASAHSLLQESVNLFRHVGDTWGEAFAVRALGDTALVTGDPTSAETLYKDSLALWRKIGDPWGLAMTLHDLGRSASMQGNYTPARTLYTESAALVRQIGDKWGLALVLVGLGHAMCHEQDAAQAEAIFKECLELWRELGNRVGVIQCVSGFAGVATVRGDAARAARLFGAASALYRSIGFALEGTTRTEFDRNVAAARDQIDAATWSAAWREGEALTLDQAVAHALCA